MQFRVPDDNSIFVCCDTTTVEDFDKTKCVDYTGSYADNLLSDPFSFPFPNNAPLPCKSPPTLTCPGGAYFHTSACYYCAAGKYGNIAGATTETAACTGECAIGTYGIITGATTETDGCTNCPSGKYGPSPGASSCEDCEAGKYGNIAGATTERACENCNAGKYSASAAFQCTDCAAGKYGNIAEATTETAACTGECAIGKYGIVTGATTETGGCTNCQSGKYGPSSGASSCKDCEAGKYGNIPGETTETAACQNCDAGKYSAKSGMGACTDCNTGKYSLTETNANSADVCISCDAGKYSADEGAPSDVCKDCAAGSYSLGGNASCTSCATNTTTKPQINSYDVTLQDNQNDCYPIPFISNISPNNQISAGGIETTFTGFRFSDNNIIIKTNGKEWTSITYTSETSIEAISPAGVGGNIVVQLIINDIDSSLNSASPQAVFSYKPPNITSILSPPFDGGTVIIFGTDFGTDVGKIGTISIFDLNGCGAECTSPELYADENKILCQYAETGSSGLLLGVTVAIGNQVSEQADMKYEFDKGELNGVPAGIQKVTETSTLTYYLTLSDGKDPTQNVVVDIQATTSILSNSTLNCTVIPSTITFLATDSNITQFEVQVQTMGNEIDEGTNAVAYTCVILHTLSSDDPQYESSPSRTVTLQIINDDVADVRLYTINADDVTYGYDVKFLSFYNLEGEQFQYGMRLESEPRKPVYIELEITLLEENSQHILDPPVLVGIPSNATFLPSNWNIHQRFTIASIQNFVDHNVEEFRIVHKVTTNDAVFQEKANSSEILISVKAADDDTAQLLVESKRGLTLRVNDNTEQIKLIGLASKPTHNVSIHVIKPFPELEVVYNDNILLSNESLEIEKNAWNTFTAIIKFKALEGAPSGAAIIQINP
eukprot:g11916.t1